MLVYILAKPFCIHRDNAEFPFDLDFSRVDGELRFEVCTKYIGNRVAGPDRVVRPLAAINLTDYERYRGQVISQLLYKLNALRGMPDYEEIIRNAVGPTISFGHCEFNSAGFMF